MPKILSIVGARPQFVKLAPLSRRIREHFTEVIVHTGQHFDRQMSDAFFSDLNIPAPDYNLNIGSGSHGVQTGNMLMAIEEVLIKEKPALVVVFGDTNSTLAGALAAVKLHIPVVHIEAGLRSFNRSMPEEINRIATDHVSDYLFAPTPAAMANIEKEGLTARSTLTGDIMVDALLDNIGRARESSAILQNMKLEPESYSLLTLHRPYNVDDPVNLRAILTLLARTEERVVFPVHPRTRNIIRDHNIRIPENIITTEPVGYLDFLYLQSHSQRVITDSGGIQKEAYILRKPCLTLRPETEWVETVEAGWNRLIDYHRDDAAEQISHFIPPEDHLDLFGLDVAARMTGHFREWLGGRNL
ncbi:MAG: non-hydrolyzing UDP-N-acetylglucosamine 2-epimerase [Cyclonatronaceae bacterium]